MKHFESSQKTPTSMILLLVASLIVGFNAFQKIKNNEMKEHPPKAAANNVVQPMETHSIPAPYVEIATTKWMFVPTANPERTKIALEQKTSVY